MKTLEDYLKICEAVDEGVWENVVWCSDDDSNCWAAIGPRRIQPEDEEELLLESVAAQAAHKDAKYITTFNPRFTAALIKECIAARALLDRIVNAYHVDSIGGFFDADCKHLQARRELDKLIEAAQ